VERRYTDYMRYSDRAKTRDVESGVKRDSKRRVVERKHKELGGIARDNAAKLAA